MASAGNSVNNRPHPGVRVLENKGGGTAGKRACEEQSDLFRSTSRHEGQGVHIGEGQHTETLQRCTCSSHLSFAHIFASSLSHIHRGPARRASSSPDMCLLIMFSCGAISLVFPPFGVIRKQFRVMRNADYGLS